METAERLLAEGSRVVWASRIDAEISLRLVGRVSAMNR